LTDDHPGVKNDKGKPYFLPSGAIENNGLRQVLFRLNCLLRIQDGVPRDQLKGSFMKIVKIVCRFSVTAFLLLLAVGVQAQTSDVYYQAGLKLYSGQDYSRALQYFGAAIKLDPQNAAAYQGRGNCYYAKADYADALQDYRQVQQLRPSPEISQFIDLIQAKMGGASSPDMMMGASSGDYQGLFEKGKLDFQSKQYTAAAKDFETALQKNHTGYNLFYYLGLTYKFLGDFKNATLALGLANQIKSTPQLSSYVKSFRLKLSQDDRDWVDEQLSAAAGGKEINLHTRPVNATDYALRLEGGAAFPNLTDFTAEANNGTTFALSQNGSASYNASEPTVAAYLGFEPVVNLAQDIELGFVVAVMPVGTFSEQYSQGGITTSNSYEITAYELGLNLRWLIGEGPVKFFIAAGPLLAPISINYSNVMNDVPINGNFTSWGFGGQVQLGVDFHVLGNISFGPFVTLQAISANNFSGDLIDNANNLDINATLYTLPNGQWPFIKPIPSSQTPPSGASPTTVDLSGIVPGFHLSMFF
jgi:tetratricopeptide (TPR) repeat protein